MPMFFEHPLKKVPEALFRRNENTLDTSAPELADAKSMHIVTLPIIHITNV